MNTKSFEKIINEAWENKNQVNSKSGKKIIKAIDETIELLDDGKIRVAEKKNAGCCCLLLPRSLHPLSN